MGGRLTSSAARRCRLQAGCIRSRRDIGPGLRVVNVMCTYLRPDGTMQVGAVGVSERESGKALPFVWPGRMVSYNLGQGDAVTEEESAEVVRP